MPGLVFRKIACLVTNAGVAAKGGVRPNEPDLGLISDAALVFSPTRGVLWSGSDKNIPKEFRGKSWRTVNCKGLTAYPGLVDAHTHPVFAGDRSREFELRMRGATYQEIAAAGGGIATTVRSTRTASPRELGKLLAQRLERAKQFGVRLLEAKSGYGLDVVTEIRSLEVIKSVRKKIKGIEVVATCLAAHAVPPERKGDRELYLREIEEKILPKVAKNKLAEYVDVFCDQGYFTLEEAIRLVKAAHALGLSARLHGEELAHTGIAAAAAALGVHSVDHLLKVDDAGIKALAKAGTVAVLLPGTSFYLRETPAPARKLVDSGVVVAIASDFNPGTCPTQNLPFIGSVAAISLGLTTAEIIAAVTWNAARSLRREKTYGALLPGYRGLPAFAAGDHPSALFYGLAPAALPDPLRN
ncbi:MAG: imidazolonepropionase [Bacteriovoracia bacterium]